MATIEIQPLTTSCGAEVRGVDLRERLADDAIAELRRAWLDHGVLFFRDQALDDIAQRDFAERFGVLQTFMFGERPTPEAPEVHVIDFAGGGAAQGRGADMWHNDVTFTAVPPIGSMLRAVTLPSFGGDTCFANTNHAYESVAAPLRRLIDDLYAVHDYRMFLPTLRNIRADADEVMAERTKEFPPVRHPVAIVHPETGRRHLYVNANYTSHIEGLSERESATILRVLYEAVRAPEVQCRFTWTPGSVAFWDNRAVQHYAVADYSERRRMHRVTVLE